MPRRYLAPDVVLVATLLLVAAAVIAAALTGPDDAGRRAGEELLRDLDLPGLGRATGLARCPASFDLRLDGGCALDLSPFPGSGALCPDHALPAPGGER